MRIKQLDHYNIIANKAVIERVIAFYIDILGFENDTRPDFEIEGTWLYREGKPLVHLAVFDLDDEQVPGLYDTTTGAVHHIAFDAAGFDEFKSTLEKNEINYFKTVVPGTSIQQLFFHDPAGVRIELNFKNG